MASKSSVIFLLCIGTRNTKINLKFRVTTESDVLINLECISILKSNLPPECQMPNNVQFSVILYCYYKNIFMRKTTKDSSNSFCLFITKFQFCENSKMKNCYAMASCLLLPFDGCSQNYFQAETKNFLKSSS